MAEDRTNEPNPAGTKVGQRIVAAAGIVAALSLFGGAVGDAFNNWSWAKEIFAWVSEGGSDCGNYAELTPQEQEKCDAKAAQQ